MKRRRLATKIVLYIMAVIILANILTASILTMVLYKNIKQEKVSTTKQLLSAIQASLETESVIELLDSDADSSTYQSMSMYLEEVREEADIDYLYIVNVDASNPTYLVDAYSVDMA